MSGMVFLGINKMVVVGFIDKESKLGMYLFVSES